MKRTAKVLFLAVMICELAADGQVAPPSSGAPKIGGPTLPEIIEQVRPSIARITVGYTFHTLEDPSKTVSISVTGTGFILDSQGHIATAGHVVSIPEPLREVTAAFLRDNKHIDPTSFVRTGIEVSFPLPNIEKDPRGNEWYNINIEQSATVLNEDDLVDIAILKCQRNPLLQQPNFYGGQVASPPLLPKLQTERPHDGEMISVSGFPLNIPVLVTNTGWIASSFFKDEKGRSLYLGSIQVNPGNSGGPAYSDVDGRIIGAVIEYRDAPEGNSGLAVIVPVQRFLDLLGAATH